VTRRAFRGRATDGVIDLAPRAQRSDRHRVRHDEGSETIPEVVVCASGNLGLIYFARLPGRVTYETMESEWPGLVASLAAHPGIGLLMVRSERQGTVIFGPRGTRRLADDDVDGADPLAPYRKHALAGLRRLDAMKDCGDIVVISLLDTETDEVAAFEELIGSHGGLGGQQTEPFILHPADWPIDGPLIGAEAVYHQLRRWMEESGLHVGRPGSAVEAPSTSS